MSARMRVIGTAMAIIGMAVVYSPRASASARTQGSGTCDTTNDTHHCCACNGNQDPNGCAISSQSGVIKCDATSCYIDLCVLG